MYFYLYAEIKSQKPKNSLTQTQVYDIKCLGLCSKQFLLDGGLGMSRAIPFRYMKVGVIDLATALSCSLILDEPQQDNHEVLELRLGKQVTIGHQIVMK